MQATLVQYGQYAQAVRNTSMLPNRRAHVRHFNVTYCRYVTRCCLDYAMGNPSICKHVYTCVTLSQYAALKCCAFIARLREKTDHIWMEARTIKLLLTFLHHPAQTF